MLSSLPSRWMLAFVCSSLIVAGCATSTDTPQGETGSLSLDLVIADGTEIDQVGWQITGNGMDMSGTIDVSAPGSTASVEVFGLPPNDGVGDEEYVVELSAVSVDGEVTCRGSAPFDVEVGKSTDVMVMLNCKLPETLGGVRVNGKFNICAELAKVVVSPLQTSVGNDIDLSSVGVDAEGDPIKYIWTGDGGSIDDPSAPNTTYTCEEVGKHSVTILVTDNDVYCKMATWTVPVTCVKGDGGNSCDDVVCVGDGNQCTATECNPANGMCETSNVEDGTQCEIVGIGDGVCSSGDCVEVDLCDGVECPDDGNECTTAECNAANGMCETSNVDNGTECEGGEGMCVDGDCVVIIDKCSEVICDDTGNDCTEEKCNSETGMCDTMNIPDGTECNGGAGACSNGECIDNNLCDNVNCSSNNDCVQDGNCDPADGSCIPGDNQPADTTCADGGTVCDGAGNCVECNSAGQCPDDGNDCTAAACEGNACAQNNVMEGQACDFGGSDGICEAGTCVEAPGCTIDAQCDDGNPCTAGACTDGMCVFTPVDGGTCEVSAGVPGTCSGGSCVGLCDSVDCTSTAQCVDDGTCDDQTGNCVAGNDQPADTICTENGGSVCDGAGNCVECNNDGQCAGGEVCTDNVCVSGSVDYPLQSLVMTVGCSNNVTGDVSILDFRMDVDPGPMSPNSAFTADLGGTAAFVESFLDAAQSVVPGGVRSAQVFGVAASVAVRSGATGADVELGPDFTTLENRCSLTGVPCTGAPGQGDCLVIPSISNLCAQGFTDVPVIEGVPDSAGGCTQPAVGTPVPDCDCTACEALDPAGCRPGDPDVPCTKGDECNTNGFCVDGDLVLALTNAVGNYTAGSSGSDILFGWYDGLTPPVAPGLLSLPAAVFANPPAPLGVRVSAGGLFVALQCLMGVDSGGPNGVTTCQGGDNDGMACNNPFDNSNNACVGSDDAGLPCAQESATACTAGSAGECVNADCGSGATCEVANLAATTADALLNTFVVP